MRETALSRAERTDEPLNATARAAGAARALTINGAQLAAQPSGALFWPDRATLIVADLHLEKGSSFARRGQFLPPYDSRATLARLRAEIDRLAPARVICLGDSFHDDAAADRLSDADRDVLCALTARCDWLWVAGNHDPAPPRGLGGRAARDGWTDGPLVFRHEAQAAVGGRKAAATAPGEISGHFHPKAAVARRGRRLSARCFVEDGRRLVLPAFGAYTGGLDALDPAISGLFPRGFRAHLLGPRGIHSLTRTALAGRR